MLLRKYFTGPPWFFFLDGFTQQDGVDAMASLGREIGSGREGYRLHWLTDLSDDDHGKVVKGSTLETYQKAKDCLIACGLRCPSEVLTLKWVDVNLPEKRMTVHAPKTEHHADGGIRACPIFPELFPHLEAAWNEAEDGNAVYVVDRYRGGGVNLRATFEKIIKSAGRVPWPRLFQNLRASRETKLMATFPLKDVTRWIGKSECMALAHYAMTSDEAFQNATTSRSVVASQGNQEPRSTHQEKTEIAKTQQENGP